MLKGISGDLERRGAMFGYGLLAMGTVCWCDRYGCWCDACGLMVRWVRSDGAMGAGCWCDGCGLL